jgi:hypothetical protein
MIESDWSRDEQCLTHLNGPIEKRLTWPDALEQSTGIPKDRMKDPQASTSRQYAFGDHLPHTGDFAADLGLGKRSE